MSLIRERKVLLVWFLLVIIILFLPITKYRLKETVTVKEVTRITFLEKVPRLILKRPIFGWGLDNFKNIYYSEYPELAGEGHFHPHNVILSISFQLGLVGLLVFLLSFLVYFKALVHYLLKIKNSFAAAILWGGIGSIIDFFVHGMVDETFRAYQGPYVLFFILGISFWLINKNINPE
jgi:O-antigen ligase